MTNTRERLIDAAFELFEAEGYDGTTVDAIATRAGTGRSTFFRHFRGKEDVVLPHHDQLLARVAGRLETAAPTTRPIAVREAARIVLDHYLSEGTTARTRHRLASTVPAIRDREIASVQRYVRLFAQHVRGWLDGEADGPLRAELVASAVVSAHNHVLRRWLRAELDDAGSAVAFDRALDLALLHLNAPAPTASPTIVITSGAVDVEQVLHDVRAALSAPGKNPGAADLGPT